MIDNEHTAVENELLREANKRDAILYDLFNKNFYALEGLQYAFDWKTQIDNLKRLKKKIMDKTFKEYYHQKNTVFMVSGDFNKKFVLNTFKRYLKKAPNHLCLGNPFTNKSCFSLKKQVIYVPDPSNTTTQLLFGFPTKIHVLHELYKTLDTGLQIMKNLLFERLRTQLKLVYGISVNAVVNSCGASVQIEVFVNDTSAKKVIKEIMTYLKKYKKELVPIKHFTSVKTNARLISRNLSITPETLATMFLDKYMNQIQEPNKQITTIQQDLNDINDITIHEIKQLYNEIFIDDHLLLAYQSSKNLRISEKHLII